MAIPPPPLPPLLPLSSHAPECLVEVALLSHACPAVSGALPRLAPVFSHANMGHVSGAIRFQRSQKLRVSIWHQSRGLATRGGGGGDGDSGSDSSSNSRSNDVRHPTATRAVRLLPKHQEGEKPRLICLLRRTRHRVGRGGNTDTAAGRRTFSRECSPDAGIPDLVSIGGSVQQLDLDNFVGVTNAIQQVQETQRQQVTGGVLKVAQGQRTPEAAIAPPFSCTTSFVMDDKDDRLVYNVFTQRVVKRSAASVRSLAILGIGVCSDVQKLDVIDPDTLAELREKLIERKVSWPTSWRSVLFRQLHHVLLRAAGRDEAIVEVRGLLRTHYQRAETRRGVGVVTQDGGAETTDGVFSGGSDVLKNDVSLREQLFTYRDLNEEQQRVVNFVLEGYNTYIGGGAGTGKSLLLRVIKQAMVAQGLAVAMTATTGIAATRVNGVTLHHCFGVNVYGEFTRLAELRAFDVIIVDEVSMLSKEFFESLEYQLRRANGVDLPFGGVQIILSGDFLQLGAIASLPLVHSALFRRHFAMVKLQKVVRQGESTVFVQQLQELRRGTVPHDLQDTVTFLSPAGSAKLMGPEGDGAVKLLPTNREVDAVNQLELDRLSGELVVFPAKLQPPTLAGRWTPTYMLRILHDDPDSVDMRKLTLALEKYVMEFVGKVSNAQSLTLLLLGQRNIVLYKLFVDAFAFRVRIPGEMNEKDEQELARHLCVLESWLPAQGLDVRLSGVIESPEGLHTDVDEYALTRYANNSPMASPLRLKKGAKVMLRTNLSPSLVNGSLGVVVGFRELRSQQLPKYLSTPGRLEAMDSYVECLLYEHGFETAIVPEVDFGGGRVILVPPTTFCVGGLSNTNHYHMAVVALPLSLAYAFTVHKVQGLTLVGRVHLELSRMWPCEHLLYVAMSRVRNPDQLTVSSFHNDLVRCAAQCLVFDDSLPPIERVRVPAHLFQATWRRAPGRRKASLRLKLHSRDSERRSICRKQKETLKKVASSARRGR